MTCDIMSRWAHVWAGTGVGSVLLLSACLLLRKRKKRPDTNIIIMTRYPTPGATKTRLIPDLGPSGAAWAQRYMSEHLFSTAKELLKGTDPPHVTVEYTGAIEPHVARWLGRRFKNLDVSWSPQLPSPCLGEKLAHAMKASFEDKFKYTIIIGSDIPGISAAVLNEARDLLKCEATDVVLGKATDGGYYLIGSDESCKDNVDDVFNGIQWGTHSVFQQQAVAVRRLELKLQVLPTVLSDVDHVEDLTIFENAFGVSVDELKHPRWSVIIPTYNEASNIKYTLTELFKSVSNPENLAEVIVSDGGSSDNTIQICQDFAKSSPVEIKVVTDSKGRGPQQHAAVQVSSGSLLIFLHADTKLPENFDKIGREALAVPGNAAAAFQLDFDGLRPEIRKSKGLPELDWWWSWKMFLMLLVARAARGREDPYGDQALMMTRTTYNQVGGFDQVLLLEDLMMVEKLKNLGHIVTLPECVITSSRRFEKKGPILTSLMNRTVVTCYHLGMSPDRLARMYYGKNLKVD